MSLDAARKSACATTLFIVAITTAALAQTPNTHASLQVRLGSPCSSHNAARPVKDPDAPGTLCLERTPFLTEHDVESAQIHHNAAGHPVILLTFRHEAAMRELQITKKNIGNRVGLVLNGRLLAAPHISAASRLLFLDGNFTQAQAESLVEAFNREAGQHK